MVEFFEFEGKLYPDYLKQWKAATYIFPFASLYCQGLGIDVGAGDNPFPGAIPVDKRWGGDAMNLPAEDESLDYIFASHVLEHIEDPLSALRHWLQKLKENGILFLYSPDPDMAYWVPGLGHCRKHLHIWTTKELVRLVEKAGFEVLIWSYRDLYYSFAVVARKKTKKGKIHGEENHYEEREYLGGSTELELCGNTSEKPSSPSLGCRVVSASYRSRPK